MMIHMIDCVAWSSKLSRCKVSCTVEELGAGQCQGRVKTGRGRGDIEKNILVTETAGPYHLRGECKISPGPHLLQESCDKQIGFFGERLLFFLGFPDIM